VIDDGDQPEFDERKWIGRELSIGPEVTVRIREPMPRCVMVTLPQVGLDADRHLLKSVARANDNDLGLVADVATPGRLRLGDVVRLV
jgi:uncharacterized protein YcbX